MTRTYRRLARHGLPWALAALAWTIPATAFADDQPDNADRVYVLDGATISWDLDRREMRAPTAGQTARLAEAMELWLGAKQASDGRWAAREIEAETLPNGVRRARLPLSSMSFAVIGGHEEPVGLCAEGPSSAREALAASAAATPEEK